MDALISIPTHTWVPFINSRGPFTRIVVHSWQRKALQELGFRVEVHEEPYDSVATHNCSAAAVVRAAQEAEVTPVVAEVSPAAQEVETSVVAEVTQEVEVTPVVAEVAEVTQEAETAPAVAEVAQEAETAPAVAEGLPVAEAADAPQEPLDLDKLRVQVAGLRNLKDALQLIADLGLGSETPPTKLVDAKELLVRAIDEAMPPVDGAAA